jgi:hypothetical protein
MLCPDAACTATGNEAASAPAKSQRKQLLLLMRNGFHQNPIGSVPVVQVKSAQIFSDPSSGIHTREEPARLAFFHLILCVLARRYLAEPPHRRPLHLPPTIKDHRPQRFIPFGVSRLAFRVSLFAIEHPKARVGLYAETERRTSRQDLTRQSRNQNRLSIGVPA